LFSKVSGVLALHGLNVLGAEIYTRDDGVALEVFQLEALPEETSDVGGIAEDARRALRGRLSLDARLAELRSRHADAPGDRARPEPDVTIDEDASDFFTVVEVRAADRIGLLYTITRALVEMELDIALAKVSTYGEEVVDVFYVRTWTPTKSETSPTRRRSAARSATTCPPESPGGSHRSAEEYTRTRLVGIRRSSDVARKPERRCASLSAAGRAPPLRSISEEPACGSASRAGLPSCSSGPS